ncbi:MAG: iron-sulfur cluster assembly scaffold protein [Pseudomonadota bacterium]
MEKLDFEFFKPLAQDHGENPRHRGALEIFNGHASLKGDCGDSMKMWVFVQDGRVVGASFDTDGCGASRAAGSMAACLARGLTVEEAARLRQIDILNALGGLPEESEHCAFLAAETLNRACRDYLKTQP